MENAAEALKMAGFMLIFIFGLSVTMAMLSRATSAADSIIQNEDRQASYQYIEVENPQLGLSRTVTLADIIPTLYRYRAEEYIVYFYDASESPLGLYTDQNGNLVNYLDLDKDVYGDWQSLKAHVDEIVSDLIDNYSNTNFIERLGIVEDTSVDPSGSGDTDIDINKNYKRIITYTVMP